MTVNRTFCPPSRRSSFVVQILVPSVGLHRHPSNHGWIHYGALNRSGGRSCLLFHGGDPANARGLPPRQTYPDAQVLRGCDKLRFGRISTREYILHSPRWKPSACTGRSESGSRSRICGRVSLGPGPHAWHLVACMSIVMVSSCGSAGAYVRLHD